MKLSFLTEQKDLEKDFKKRIPDAEWHSNVRGDESIVFIDSALGKQALEAALGQAVHHGIYRVLVCPESKTKDHMPVELLEGWVDDVLLTPIRNVELLSKIQHAESLRAQFEARFGHEGTLKDINDQVKAIIHFMDEDIRRTRDIQHQLIPERFPQVRGMKVAHKYLSGLKSGGDYLDFFEFEDKNRAGIVMSNSNAYGLSSAFLSVMLKIGMRLSRDQDEKPSAIVEALFQELVVAMKPDNELALFHGILDRKTWILKYVHFGNIQCLQLSADAGKAKIVKPKAPALNKVEKPKFQDGEIQLMPGDRLVLMTEGFSVPFSKPGEIIKLAEKHHKEEALELINALVYEVKEELSSPDDMPAQDCSILVLDIERNVLRLTKRA